jgi:hypothetical protein
VVGVWCVQCDEFEAQFRVGYDIVTDLLEYVSGHYTKDNVSDV